MTCFKIACSAVRKDSLKVALVLVAHGAEVDASRHDGMTPLHSAAFWGSEAVAQMLVTKGASLTARNAKGQETPLHVAARRGQLRVAKVLVEAGANTTAINSDGLTPREQAIKSEHSPVAEYLSAFK